MKSLQSKVIACGFLATCLLSYGLSSKNQGRSNYSKDQINHLTEEAYQFLYPAVLMDVTRRRMTNVEYFDGKKPLAPENQFGHFRAFPPLSFKGVVRPNFDTLYSQLWMDLSKEAYVLTVPDSDKRYYLLPALDFYTDVFASPGWRTTGTGAQTFLYTGPGWQGKVPEGMVQVASPTNKAWMIGRVQTNGPEDYAAVRQFQDGLKFVPLSQYKNRNYRAPKGKVDKSYDRKTPPMEMVDNMSAKDFFTYGAKLMAEQRPRKVDLDIVLRMKNIGITAGKINYNNISSKYRNSLDGAPERAQKAMKNRAATMGRKVNGWALIEKEAMGVYGIDYLQRAAIALIGLGANSKADAIYPQLHVDSKGKKLNGSNFYKLHFNKNELPPTATFWSLTLYDSKGFAVPNKYNKATISSWMPLKYNKDGSLDLYFSSNPPKNKEFAANWLPAPKNGVFNLTLRDYAPQVFGKNKNWTPPPLVQMQSSQAH
jgi:hypothetical protein